METGPANSEQPPSKTPVAGGSSSGVAGGSSSGVAGGSSSGVAGGSSSGVIASGPVPTQCPRCQQALDGEYYGVCSTCATNLRETYSGESRGDVSAADYEPKMNVTPNAIASKE